MNTKNLRVGTSELELLNYVAASGGRTVGQVAEHFAQSKGWVRTTAQKIMDRLLAKGLLTRSEVDHVYQYRSTLTVERLHEGLVNDFVSESLGGSLRPFVAYLSGGAHLTKEDVDQLRELVARLDKEGA